MEDVSRRLGGNISCIRLGLVALMVALAVSGLAVLKSGVTHAAPPTNDNFADATVITDATGVQAGTTEEATAEAGEPTFHTAYSGLVDDLYGRSIWYSWTAPEGVGPTTFVVQGDQPSLGFYTGSLGALTEVAYNLQSELSTSYFRAQVQLTPTVGVTYHIGIGSKAASATTLSWAPTAAPPNDNFADAIPLPADVTGNTAEATFETGESPWLGGRSVWYSYTPAESTAIAISLEGSSFDTVIAVYTGSLGMLSEVGYNDDASGDVRWSRLSFAAAGGTTYYVGIGGYTSGGPAIIDGGQVLVYGDSGDYVLQTLGPAPNDNFADATPISGETGTASGRTDGTAEIGEPGFHTAWSSDVDDLFGRSIWYTWTAPAGVGPTTVVVNGPYYPALGVYTGSLGALTEVAYNPSAAVDDDWSRAAVAFTPTAGVTYHIGIGSEYAGSLVTLSWEPTVTPPNDNFADAPALPAEALGSTVGATFQAGEPIVRTGPDGSSSDLGGRSVWYDYTPAVSGTVDINLLGSSYDTVLGVYTGSLGSLTEIAFNERAIFDLYGSRVTFAAEAGTTYHIGVGGCCSLRLDGGQVMEWGGSGTYALHASGPGLGSPNDNFADATPISGASGLRLWSTLDATAEFGEPAFHPLYATPDDLFGHSVWYSWVAPGGVGPTTFVLTSSGYDAQALGVYTGSFGSFSEVAYNRLSPVSGDELRSQVQFTPVAGVTYYIGAGSVDPAAINLSWAPTNSPANDNFAGALALSLPADVTGTTVEATFEADDPGGYYEGSDLGGRSVWYSYTADVSDRMTASMAGSDYDGLLGVYTGVPGAFEQVTFLNMHSGSFSQDFDVVAGTTYYIGVGGCCGFTMDGGQVIRWGDSGSYRLQLAPMPHTVPGAPGLEATAGDGQVELTWWAPDDGGLPIAAYTVAYKAAADSTWTTMNFGPDVFTTTISPLTNGTPYQFKVLASNALGDGPYSDVATATPTPPASPVITTHPMDLTVTAGATATFTAAASATPMPTVQWQVSTDGGLTWADILGAVSTTLSFAAQTTDNGNQYHAVFTNPVASVTTNAATLTVQWAPVIVTHPQSLSLPTGETATFTASATGNPGPTVHWEVSTDGGSTWSDLPGETSTTLSFTALDADGGKQYRAVFTNIVDSVASNAAILVVGVPVITTHPVSQSVVAGETATFTVAAGGNPAPSVQWYVSSNGRKWTIIPGATATTLTLNNATLDNDGLLFRAVFTNSKGTAVSDTAMLTVTVGTADVSITKTGVYNSSDNTITWTLTVSNAGPDSAQAVQVTDTLARGTRLVSVDGSVAGWSFKAHGAKVIVDLGALDSGQSATITIVAKLTRATLPVDNPATVTTTSMDPDLSDNTCNGTAS